VCTQATHSACFGEWDARCVSERHEHTPCPYCRSPMVTRAAADADKDGGDAYAAASPPASPATPTFTWPAADNVYRIPGVDARRHAGHEGPQVLDAFPPSGTPSVPSVPPRRGTPAAAFAREREDAAFMLRVTTRIDAARARGEPLTNGVINACVVSALLEVDFPPGTDGAWLDLVRELYVLVAAPPAAPTAAA